MKPWRQIGEAEVVHDGWRKVVRKTFVMNSGKRFVAEISEDEGAAVAEVLALTPEGMVVIARQFRVGPNKVMEELPGGFVEPGEDPEAAMLRELREETGYAPDRVTKLGETYKHAYSHKLTHCYLAEGCRKVDEVPALDEGEEIEVDLISIDQLFENAKNGMMTGAEAVFLSYEKLKELESGYEKSN